MAGKSLYILVEGNDDIQFFDRIIKPRIKGNYDSIILWDYAQKKKKNIKIKNFIRSIESMDADYIYVSDINNSPCVSEKKNNIKGKFRNIDDNRIVIVVKEIESWYLAGLSDENAKKFKIRPSNIKDTNIISKEQFNVLIPENYRDSRINFMIEILKYFCIETGKQRNKSFKYFVDKYI